MNSSESMNCAAASVAFRSPSRSSASSRISSPPAPSLVASNAACSRSCSAVSRVSSARSVSSDAAASDGTAPLGSRRRLHRVVQRRPRRRHDRRLRVGRARASHVRRPRAGLAGAAGAVELALRLGLELPRVCTAGVEVGLAGRHLGAHDRETGVGHSPAGDDRLGSAAIRSRSSGRCANRASSASDAR